MSLDLTLEHLRLFESELRNFNNALAKSVQAIQSRHDEVDRLWQDALRREYDLRWSSFHTVMERYLEREAPGFERFLESKIRSTERYLHG